MQTSWVRALLLALLVPAVCMCDCICSNKGQGHLVCTARRCAAAPVRRKHTPAARLACLHLLPLNRDWCPLSALPLQKLG